MLDARIVSAIKLFLPLAGAAVLAWGIFASTRDRDSTSGQRIRDIALLMLGGLAFFSWWNFSPSQFAGRVELHEFFHYYLGAKFQPELGYTRLYRCAVIAEIEEGASPGELASRWMRDLETSTVVQRDSVLSDTAACTDRFANTRWAAFKHDALWFRANMTPRQWNNVLNDHGYNATPVWTMTGTLLANLGPVSWTAIKSLALLDRVLLVTFWGLICWAFGWRTACVAALWWGTNYPASSHWTGGAFLRADWLVLAVAGICLLRRSRLTAGGFALAYSALLRIFPGGLLAGLGVAEVLRMLRQRTWRPSGAALRWGGGSVLASCLLILLSSGVVSHRWVDFESWEAFADNSQRHLSTASTNRMGLKALVSFEPSTRTAMLTGLWLDAPGDTWYTARNRVFERRRPLFWLLVCGFLLLLGRAVDQRPPWVAAVLGTGLMVLGDVASYYYALFLVFAFLWTERPWVGVGLCLLSAFTIAVPVILRNSDERYVAISAGIVLFVVSVTTTYALAGRAQQVYEASDVDAAHLA